MVENLKHGDDTAPAEKGKAPGGSHESWLAELSRQTKASERRNDNDIRVDNAWVDPDRSSIKAVERASSLLGEMAQRLKQGEKLRDMGELPANVIKAHQELNKLDRADLKGDLDAIAKDKADIIAEKRNIAASTDALASGSLNPEQVKALTDNIASKGRLISNEASDRGDELGYARNDRADMHSNDRLINGILHNSPELPSLIEAANKSHARVLQDRKNDLAKEPKYVDFDRADQVSNAAVRKAFKIE